jgi:hypothetical protein
MTKKQSKKNAAPPKRGRGRPSKIQQAQEKLQCDLVDAIDFIRDSSKTDAAAAEWLNFKGYKTYAEVYAAEEAERTAKREQLQREIDERLCELSSLECDSLNAVPDSVRPGAEEL